MFTNLGMENGERRIIAHVSFLGYRRELYSNSFSRFLEKEEREGRVCLSRISRRERNFIWNRNRMEKILTVPAPPSTRSCPWWSWSSCTRTSSCSHWSSRSRDRTCAAVYSPSCRSCSLRAAISICHVPDPSYAPSSRLCADDDRTSDYPCRVSDR